MLCSTGGTAAPQGYSVKDISLLMVAAEHGNVEVVKYLIEKGAGKESWDHAEAEWDFGHDNLAMCPMFLIHKTSGFAEKSGNQEIIDLVDKAGQ